MNTYTPELRHKIQRAPSNKYIITKKKTSEHSGTGKNRYLSHMKETTDIERNEFKEGGEKKSAARKNKHDCYITNRFLQSSMCECKRISMALCVPFFRLLFSFYLKSPLKGKTNPIFLFVSLSSLVHNVLVLYSIRIFPSLFDFSLAFKQQQKIQQASHI